MKSYKIDSMKGGWVVGDFVPTVWRSQEIEVAVKHYAAGQIEPAHHHKIAEEMTVIASGKVKMCERIFETGDIICLEPGESTSFEAIESTITVVVKRPSVANDKFLD